jgi:DHA3 family tetracycline resistance protein-like MFS transporter
LTAKCFPFRLFRVFALASAETQNKKKEKYRCENHACAPRNAEGVNMFRIHRSSAITIYLILSGVIAFASALVLTTLAVYYVTAIGMNPFQLVLAGTVFECAILLCEIPTGVIADTWSRRLSIVIGVLIMGAALLLEGAVPLLAAVLLAEVIAGVGETFLSGATDAWLAGELGEEAVGRVYLRSAQVNRLASLAGIAASAGLASIQLNLPLLLAGGLYLALGLFLMLRMPEHGFQPVPRAERESWRALFGTLQESLRAVRASRLLLALLAVGAVAGAAGEGYDKLWEAHLLLDLGLPGLGQLNPVVWFGIINAGTALASLLVAALLQRRLEALSGDASRVARALLAISALLAASVVVFGLAGSFVLAFVALLGRAVLSSLADPLYRTWLVQQTSPRTRATVLSISSQANALGETAGGPLVGAVGALFSLRAALVLAGLLLAPVVALYARTLRQTGLNGVEAPAREG